jgi:penicillin-binding protein 1C
VRRGWAVLLAAAALTGVAAFALDRIFPPDLARYATRSLELRDAGGRTLHAALAADGRWRLSARPEDVDPRYLSLLLAQEDRRFWSHRGVDPIALGRAVWQFVTHRHIVSGGSTLTMQVARLLMAHRHTVAGKLVEMARAVQLETATARATSSRCI